METQPTGNTRRPDRAPLMTLRIVAVSALALLAVLGGSSMGQSASLAISQNDQGEVDGIYYTGDSAEVTADVNPDGASLDDVMAQTRPQCGSHQRYDSYRNQCVAKTNASTQCSAKKEGSSYRWTAHEGHVYEEWGTANCCDSRGHCYSQRYYCYQSSANGGYCRTY